MDRKRAAELVERAIGLSNEYGGKPVRKPDLKRAMERYHYVVRKVGMTDERVPAQPPVRICDRTPGAVEGSRRIAL
ncbi:hypothetical protein [Burkholderia sp. BCC0097]|uniref:hypothetical protein n=1 Tax=Burkholderia sp. BCC0097 TaxID=2676289 RepID=UPI001FC85CFD|nr:hypothetical protein [Burkholderia sp. BCC0097]